MVRVALVGGMKKPLQEYDDYFEEIDELINTFDDHCEYTTNKKANGLENIFDDTTSSSSDSLDDSDKNSEVTPLVVTSPPKGYLAITINYPETTSFLNLTSREQEIVYTKIFDRIKNLFGFDSTHEITFEFTKKGKVHAHAYISIMKPHYAVGAVCDMAKAILRFLPKKNATFKPNCFFEDYKRYRDPAVCIQWIDPHAEKFNIQQWREYMFKDQI